MIASLIAKTKRLLRNFEQPQSYRDDPDIAAWIASLVPPAKEVSENEYMQTLAREMDFQERRPRLS
jgi:hypothetical protein